MSEYRLDAIVLDDDRRYQITELTQVVGLDSPYLEELINCDLIEIERHVDGTFRCTTRTYIEARRASRLVRDFELNPEGLALAMQLLKQVERLQSRLAMLPRSGA